MIHFLKWNFFCAATAAVVDEIVLFLGIPAIESIRVCFAIFDEYSFKAPNYYTTLPRQRTKDEDVKKKNSVRLRALGI